MEEESLDTQGWGKFRDDFLERTRHIRSPDVDFPSKSSQKRHAYNQHSQTQEDLLVAESQESGSSPILPDTAVIVDQRAGNRDGTLLGVNNASSDPSISITSPPRFTRSEPLLFRVGHGSSGRAKMSTSQPQQYARSDFGDTQVLPTQVYDEYNKASKVDKRGVTSAVESLQDNLPIEHASGDAGLVKLTEGIEDGGSLDEDSVDELAAEKDEEEDTRAETVTSPSHFSPITPAVIGQKRDRSGNFVSSVGRTPAVDLAAMFNSGANKPVMGLTQVFDQTQAPSSPIEGDPISDHVFERPSPLFRLQTHSSPVGNTSSPMPKQKGDFQRAITDPRHIYVSMKDSQERRRGRTELERHAQVTSSPVASDEDELSSQMTAQQAAQRERKARKRVEPIKNFEQVDAPVVQSTKGQRRKGLATPSSVKITTTPFTKESNHNYVVISDDTPAAQQENYAGGSSEDEPMDEYDELSQVVISSDRDNHVESRAVRGLSTLSKYQKTQHPMSSPTRGRFGDINRIERQQTDELQYPGDSSMEGIRQSQVVVIRDSQSDKLPPRPPDPSSITSQGFISQTQEDFSLSSRTKAQIADEDFELSSLTRPPLPSSQRDDQQRSRKVVRSPPSSANNLNSSSPPFKSRRRPNRSQNREGTNENYDSPNTRLQKAEIVPQTELKKASTSDDSKYYTPVMNEMKRIPETSPMRASAMDRLSEDIDEISTAQARSENHITHHTQTSNDLINSKDQSNNETRYDTAHTQISDSPNKSSSRQSQSNQAHNSLRVRRLTEIANDPTPPDVHESVNVDFDILNDDDLEYVATVNRTVPSSSAPKKGTPRQTRRILREPAKEINSLPPDNRTSSRDKNNQSKDTNNPQEEIQEPRDLGRKVVEKKRKLKTYEKSQRLKKISTDRVDVNAEPDTDRDPLGTEGTASGNDESVVNEKARPLNVEGPVRLSIEEEDQDPLHVERVSEHGNDAVRVANRVFACYKNNFMYYPAMVLGPGAASAAAYSIKFDDGNADEIEPHSMARLELRMGDQVKVDLSGKRKSTYVVRGFKDRLHDLQENEIGIIPTDIYGFKTLILAPAQRQSLPAAQNSDLSHQIEVPISSIYLTKEMKKQFVDRPFVGYVDESVDSSKAPTPIHSKSTTPSKLRRHTVSGSAQIAKAQIGTPVVETKTGLFSGMLFAISYSNNQEAEKIRVTKMILSNGGRVLADGFDELFGLPKAADATSPKTNDPTSDGEEPNLKLFPNNEETGFTALIADSHSRKEKYIQALALNIPCLSGRWIVDCNSRNSIISWAPYLLVAGESSFLNGVLHSRILRGQLCTYTSASKLVLSDIVNYRPNLFEGKSVILVIGNGGEQRHRFIIFITYALGAKHVEKVSDISSAKKLIDESDGWDWVYVDNVKATKTKQLLNGSSKSSKNRKSGGAAASKTDVKVVDMEFIVQSLILGALLETDGGAE